MQLAFVAFLLRLLLVVHNHLLGVLVQHSRSSRIILRLWVPNYRSYKLAAG